MAELATIARPYAEALFKSAKLDLSGTAAWLDQFAAIASNEQLLQFADSPKVTDEQVLDTSVKARLDQMKIALTA